MSRSSARRAQVEPFPALAAVAVLGLALSAYAAVMGDFPVDPVTDATADPALIHVLASLRDGTVVDPSLVHDAVRAVPGDHWVALRVDAGAATWSAGPTPPADAATASRRVPVRVRPGLIRAGTVTVWVWP